MIYKCINDLAKGDFGIGHIGYENYWRKLALEWLENDNENWNIELI